MATGSYERKSFTGGAAPTTLGANLGVGATSLTVADGSSYPDGATGPFVVVVNRNTSSEEKILIASRTGDVLSVETRGYDNGTDQAHTIGETVEHILDASTVDQANRYVNLQSSKGDLVAHDGTNPNAVTVGTDGDILTADSTASTGVAWSNRLTTAESEIDTLQSDVTTLQGTDINVTLTGDVTGTATITNLGDVSIATVVGDDSHSHVIGNIDNFTEEVQDIVGAMVTGNTESGISVTYDDTDGTLDFNVNDPSITLTGDVTGTATMSNLGNVSITATVVDDLHNHTIANVDGLQTALDAKLASSSYTAADVLAKLKTVDGSGSGLDADKLDGVSSGSFLRSDADDSTSGTLTVGGVSKYLKIKDTVAGSEAITFATENLGANRTITFPDSSGTVALEGGALDGGDITSGTVADARIASTITRDSEVSSSTWALYGYSSVRGTRNPYSYYTIWVTTSSPNGTGGNAPRNGDIWIDI